MSGDKRGILVSVWCVWVNESVLNTEVFKESTFRISLIDCGSCDCHMTTVSPPGYGLLHSLVFTRLFPTLIHLYVLHHDDEDLVYQKGLNFLKEMDDDRFVRYIRFPE